MTEKLSRGFNHDSPMDYDDSANLGDIDVDANREELLDRCADCASRAGVPA